MGAIRLATGNDVPAVPTWLSLGPALRVHAERWLELGPMTLGDYALQAPSGARTVWLSCAQDLRRKGALVKSGRKWVCKSEPNDIERKVLESTDYMVNLDMAAHDAAGALGYLSALRRCGSDTSWFTLDNEGLKLLWDNTVTVLSEWERRTGDRKLGGLMLARQLKPLMRSRGFLFRRRGPALTVIRPEEAK